MQDPVEVRVAFDTLQLEGTTTLEAHGAGPGTSLEVIAKDLSASELEPFTALLVVYQNQPSGVSPTRSRELANIEVRFRRRIRG